MHRVHRAAGGRSGDHRKQAAGENAKAALFPFHIQAAVGAKAEQMRISAGFRPHHHRHADHENQRHRPQDGAPLTAIADRFAKGKTQRRRDQEDRQHLHQVG